MMFTKADNPHSAGGYKSNAGTATQTKPQQGSGSTQPGDHRQATKAAVNNTKATHGKK